MIRGDQTASARSPEVMRSKHEGSRRAVLTRSPTRTPPEPRSCNHLHSLGCEIPLEKPVTLCGTLASARHTSETAAGAVRGACAPAGALAVRGPASRAQLSRRASQVTAVGLHQPGRRRCSSPFLITRERGPGRAGSPRFQGQLSKGTYLAVGTY